MFKYTCAAAAILLLAGCQSMHKKEVAPEQFSYQCGTTPLTWWREKSAIDEPYGSPVIRN